MNRKCSSYSLFLQSSLKVVNSSSGLTENKDFVVLMESSNEAHQIVEFLVLINELEFLNDVLVSTQAGMANVNLYWVTLAEGMS